MYVCMYICIYIYIYILVVTCSCCKGLRSWQPEAQARGAAGGLAPTKNLDFEGFDSSKLLILKGGNSHVRVIS